MPAQLTIDPSEVARNRIAKASLPLLHAVSALDAHLESERLGVGLLRETKSAAVKSSEWLDDSFAKTLSMPNIAPLVLTGSADTGS